MIGIWKWTGCSRQRGLWVVSDYLRLLLNTDLPHSVPEAERFAHSARLQTPAMGTGSSDGEFKS